ncbi:ABC transporter ATP-binding protein/permease [Nonomuraea turcica]|uniref:ABC transporter ATP-binding protein/permease n=1 Tax=Nonomuraea sp. G32 TaxID=3067274 RepID=UPI00273CC515|nr:ATP-binding cassette domain-containing protein [Nonomuraea sp. G32]MDP4504958.1 ATP-binding cassette domain-containing protein [Nonomuraea sp. G32]
MATNERTAPAGRSADALLAAYAAAAGRWFGLAGVLMALETVFTVVRWGALAWIAQGVMDHSTAQDVQCLAVFAGASVLALVAGWTAGELRRRGARTVAGHLRRRLAGALVPTARRIRETEPAEAALTMVDLVDSVADYHAQIAPLRRSAPLSMLAVLAVVAVLHWPAAIVLILTSALLPVNMRLAGLFAQDGADRQWAATQRLNAVVLDSFRGLRTLRELHATGRRGRTLRTAAERLNTATMSVLRRAFLSGLVMDVVLTFSIAVNATYIGLSLLGYVRVPHAPGLTLFTGLTVLLLCPMYFAPMRALASAFHQRERAAVAAGAIGALVEDLPAEAPRAVRPRLSAPAGVSLRAVRFRYPGAAYDAIAADADIAPATWTVITGASGAGKSTLLSLIAGQRPPSTGAVRWMTASGWQAPALGAAAWVGQHTVLLDATVGDNIRLGRPDATDHQLEQAVDAAGLRPVIERLPGGLDTRLGEGGWGVSTGEVRRIAIARAFVRGAGLWVLDEPTAHLDADSEHDVVEALRRATRGCTVIIATHSAALAAAADTVLAIDNGRLHHANLVSAR